MNNNPIYIPLGTRCSAAYIVRDVLKKREFSLPFDWVDLPISSVLNLLSIEGDIEQFVHQYADNIEAHTQRHKEDKTWFVHDFLPKMDYEDVIKGIKERYTRRFKRLYELFESENDLIFISVFSAYDKENIVVYDKIIELLKKKTNSEHIMFLTVNLYDYDYIRTDFSSKDGVMKQININEEIHNNDWTGFEKQAGEKIQKIINGYYAG